MHSYQGMYNLLSLLYTILMMPHYPDDVRTKSRFPCMPFKDLHLVLFVSLPGLLPHHPYPHPIILNCFQYPGCPFSTASLCAVPGLPFLLLLLRLLLLLLNHVSHVQLCVTHQAPWSLGSSRQEHWSGLPCPSPMHESEK